MWCKGDIAFALNLEGGHCDEKDEEICGSSFSGDNWIKRTTFLEPSISAAETSQVQEENVNAIHVKMNQSEHYLLSGRSIDVLSGDKEAIQLNKYTISFSKPGEYVIRVNGCVYDDIYTFTVSE